jgi:hypothetical protein
LGRKGERGRYAEKERERERERGRERDGSNALIYLYANVSFFIQFFL